MIRENPLRKIYVTVDKGDIQDKIKNLPSFPKIIELEITNICNFHCIMCKTGMDIAQRNKGMMTEEIFNKMINEVEGHDTAVKFVGFGESLINKEFLHFAQIAKSKGIVCHLTTNGSLLTEDIMKKLIDIKFDSVKFSFQGVDHQGYEIMRQRSDFEELLKKISRFKDLRGEMEYPYITIGTSITNESKEQVNQFKNNCQNICDRIEVGTTTLEFMEIDKIKNEEYKAAVKKLQEVQTLNKVRYQCCNQIFDVLTVRWNGDVSSCCADVDGVMKLGNIMESSLKELWECPRQKHYRQILGQNRYEDLPLCKDCYDYMGYMGSTNKRI